MEIKKLMRNHIFISASSAVALSAFVYLGFSVNPYIVGSCNSSAKTYVTAEYSETVTGIDMDGNIYTEVDYWSEPASEVYSISAINEIIEVPPMPPHDVSMSNGLDFDYFKNHTDTKLEVYAKSAYTDEHTIFNEKMYKSEDCIKMLNTPVMVKEWYGITYSSDF